MSPRSRNAIASTRSASFMNRCFSDSIMAVSEFPSQPPPLSPWRGRNGARKPFRWHYLYNPSPPAGEGRGRGGRSAETCRCNTLSPTLSHQGRGSDSRYCDRVRLRLCRWALSSQPYRLREGGRNFQFLDVASWFRAHLGRGLEHELHVRRSGALRALHLHRAAHLKHLELDAGKPRFGRKLLHIARHELGIGAAALERHPLRRARDVEAGEPHPRDLLAGGRDAKG